MTRGRGGITNKSLLSYARPRTAAAATTDPTLNGLMPRGRGGITKRVAVSHAPQGTMDEILDDSASNGDMRRGNGGNTRKGGLSYAPQAETAAATDPTLNGAMPRGRGGITKRVGVSHAPQGTMDEILDDSTSNGNETFGEDVSVTNSGPRLIVECSQNQSLIAGRKQLTVVNGL